MGNPSTKITGATNGANSSEHNVTWKTMLAALAVIACQVAGQLWLGIDLGVNIDLALSLGFGSGAVYTLSRMVVKAGISYANGKVDSGSEATPEPEKAALVDREPNLGGKRTTTPPAFPLASPEAFPQSPATDTRKTY